jgi:hypothetical protein
MQMTTAVQTSCSFNSILYEIEKRKAEKLDRIEFIVQWWSYFIRCLNKDFDNQWKYNEEECLCCILLSDKTSSLSFLSRLSKWTFIASLQLHQSEKIYIISEDKWVYYSSQIFPSMWW